VQQLLAANLRLSIKEQEDGKGTSSRGPRLVWERPELPLPGTHSFRRDVIARASRNIGVHPRLRGEVEHSNRFCGMDDAITVIKHCVVQC